MPTQVDLIVFHSTCNPIALQRNIRQARVKHSSLFVRIVSDEGKGLIALTAADGEGK